MSEARYSTYPICLVMDRRKALVVGGGNVAARKVRDLLESGATVRVVALDVCHEIEELASSGRLSLERKTFESRDLHDMSIVVAATSDRELNQSVSKAARERCVLVNVGDEPDLSDFFVPARIKRGDLVVTVSTSGSAPGLSRLIRKELSQHLPEGLSHLVELARQARDRIRQLVPGESRHRERKELLEAVLASDARTLAERGQVLRAKEVMEEVLGRLVGAKGNS